MIKIFQVPQDYNPYQTLLANSLSNRYDTHLLPRSKYIYLTYPYHLIKASLGGTKIIHIHWLYFLRVPYIINERTTALVSYLNTQLFLLLIRLLPFKVVWTVHNVLPHKQITSNDLKIRRQLSSLCSAKIVHASCVKKMMDDKNISTQDTFTIAHGNFSDVYDNHSSRTESRIKLNLPLDGTVFLFFGRMEPYKNIPLLIQTFIQISSQKQNLHLVLAGRLVDPELRELISNTMIDEHINLHLYDKYIPNDDVQYFFNAADFTIFPYSEITSSGSVILSTTFSVPTIAPRIGALLDIPPDIGILYDPNTPDALRLALQEALKKDKVQRSRMCDASKKYSHSLSWSRIGEQTEAIYNDAVKH